MPGGSATNISHEVGSKQLLPGPGRGAGRHVGRRRRRTFTTQLVGGDFAGRDADVAVTVRTVKEKQLPELDDEFAQLASEFDTLDELRDDLRERLDQVKQVEQLYAARDKALKAARRGRRRAGAGGRRHGRGRAAASRRWPTSSSGIGASLEDYLDAPRRRPRSRSTPS